MIVREINEGPKISYEVDGTKICFDDDLSLNLAKREEDSPVHIDICRDSDGLLVIGKTLARDYVAQLDIPSRKYKTTIVPDETAPGEEKTREEREPLPLDMDTVTLTLWSLE